MAADSPDTASSPLEGAPGAEQAEGAAPGKKGGLKAFFPLILFVVVMPVVAWGTLWFKAKFSAPATAATAATAPAATKEKAEGGAGKETAKEAAKPAAKKGGKEGKEGEGETAAASATRNVQMPVPLTRDLIAYAAKDPKKDGDQDKIVTLDVKGDKKDIAQSDKLVVNMAKSGGTKFIVAAIALVSSQPDFLDKLNVNNARLIDRAVSAMSSYPVTEVEKPNFQNQLRAELLALFNQVLGKGAIQEIEFTQWVTQ